MSEEKKSPETPQEGTQKPQPERRPRTSPQFRRQQAALRYITILFAAAFVLLLFTYLMERRQTDVILQENQEQIEDLQQSVSAVQSLKNLYAENDALKEEIRALKKELDTLSKEKQTLSVYVTSTEEQRQNAELGLQAMDWFWQINEAYVRGRYSLCRSLIESLDEANLTQYLPRQSITDNERFSPYDRLAEIREIVY